MDNLHIQKPTKSSPCMASQAPETIDYPYTHFADGSAAPKQAH